MNGSRPRVVFVSHEATLTGAPVGLLQFLDWLRDHAADIDVEVVLVHGGPLAEEFESMAAVRSVEELVAAPPPDVLFLNSIFSGEVLLTSSFTGSYVVARVPELGFAIDRVLPAATRDAVLARADRFLAVSDFVRLHLMDSCGVQPDRVVTAHGSIPVDAVTADPDVIDAARVRAGLPPALTVVGALGSRTWRKGADWFIQVAVEVTRRHPSRATQFLWLGSEPDWEHGRRIEDDLRRAGIADRVHLLPDDPRPAAFQSLMDVFALTSREDPFPRVALEAAALGLPIAAFDSGGVGELLAHAGVGVLPYGDVEAMADRIDGWLEAPEVARRVGESLAQAVRAHHDLSVGAPKVLAEIRRGLR